MTALRADIIARGRPIIARELGCSPAKVREWADFRDDLGADSLGMTGLVSALEEEFKVSVSDDEAAFCQTVGTAFDLIENKLELRTLVSGGRLRR